MNILLFITIISLFKVGYCSYRIKCCSGVLKGQDHKRQPLEQERLLVILHPLLDHNKTVKDPALQLSQGFRFVQLDLCLRFMGGKLIKKKYNTKIQKITATIVKT